MPARKLLTSPITAALAGAALISCSEVFGPGRANVGGLRFDLSAVPGDVDRGGQATMRLAIVNTTNTEATVGSGSSCLAHFDVYRGGKRQDGFPGTDYLCLAVVSSWRIAGGDSLVLERDLQVPAATATGMYVLRATFEHGSPIPMLERPFYIR